ncbi:MAG: unsaturated rhamnogalacturonyl hydrolase [Chthoniobacter sp.]|jgi:lysophospholipase L1-like esterase|nr:unsaturated rhamnogalacturonyl hydrolase [Chthoniobacter sp.]
MPHLSIRPSIFLFFTGILALFQTFAALGAEDARPVEDAAKFKLQSKPNNSFPTIYLVGDSTVKVGTAGQRGWGEEITPFFDTTKVNVVNQAIGGRSSRTYQNEGRWDAALAAIQKGDYVIFQFGHNDSGALNDNSRARGTIKGNGEETEEIDNILTKQHEVVHSYGWYMRKYIRDTKAKGATPIVCSLIPRKSWTDGKMGRASESYGKWAREAAEQEGAMFVDLNEIIAQGYEKLGSEKVEPLFADGHTHTTVEGAKFNAECVIAGLRGLPAKPLDKYLSDAGREVVPFPSKK